MAPASQQDPGVPVPSRQAFRRPAPAGLPTRQGYLAEGKTRGAAWGRPSGVEGPLHRPPGQAGLGARLSAPTAAQATWRPRTAAARGGACLHPAHTCPAQRRPACLCLPGSSYPVSVWPGVSELPHPMTTTSWSSVSLSSLEFPPPPLPPHTPRPTRHSVMEVPRSPSGPLGAISNLAR